MHYLKLLYLLSMARSRHRHKHGHHGTHANHPNAPRQESRRSAVGIMVVFIAILGLGVAFISVGADIVWLITGAVIGAFAGYLIGRSMDKVAAKK